MRKIFLFAFLILLFAQTVPLSGIMLPVDSWAQKIPVEYIISAGKDKIIRELVHRTSTILPEWNRCTLVDTLRLSGSADVDTTIAYNSWERIALMFTGSQANDSTDVKIYLYCGICFNDSVKSVVLVDSLDTSVGVDNTSSWTDGSGKYLWSHNVPLSSHFFYIFNGIAATGTNAKYYDGYIIRFRK